MTNDLIERGAKALYAHENGSEAGWDDLLSERGRDMWRKMFCVAVRAMREPTDAMVEAVGSDWGPHLEGNWRKMIDEALK